MKEIVHEDSTNAAKTLLIIYYAKLNDNILWILPGQKMLQWSINDSWSCIIGNLRGD